ncbi:NADP/FAD dependent oxidoreductase [Colletotrichum abscissum]|uniref:NADP/FAD dependent oxidoreductase n=1 Tax=Colletotrichum abscissum TaxID=1671311 RepID=A0A9P9XNJ9_9PEZI|nr:NADP/FAD dependent oxidoreductase [Colletotrichum abscissum]KAI3556761.1 NADP/FAD dependent oxidoreductase [Colletotrichum abscissum]KAK1505358.1 NADP/FAD dependent oxidoreductase [Colletotrichum abscissum]
MEAYFGINNTQNCLFANAINLVSKESSFDDIFLLPLVVLGSIYVFNKGSLLPRRDPYRYKWFEKPQLQRTQNLLTEKKTRNISEKIEELQSDIVIFWGSQSGTAEAFAHRLARDFHQRFKLNALVADLSDYDPETISLIPGSKLAVFIMSTYGEGDPSDNAQDFVSWADAATGVSLAHLKYAAFGCGNSNYRFYNKVIDDVVVALSKFNATAVLPTGKGDEATRTTEEDFMDWKESLFKTLVSNFDYQEYEVAYEPSVGIVSSDSNDLHKGEPFYKPHSRKATTLHSPIAFLPVKAKRDFAKYDEKGRSCIDLEVDLTAQPEIKYKTGDHIAIWPVNPDEEISLLIRILGLQSQQLKAICVVLQSADKEPKVPSPTTVQALFRHYLEICSAVPRETVLSLAQFAPSQKVKSELMTIGNDRAVYSNFLEANHLTLARLLENTIAVDPAVTWAGLPLSFIIDFLPAMQPRLYSISTSRITSPRSVGLTVSVKPSQLLGNQDITVPGLTSTYLSGLQPGSHSPSEIALMDSCRVHAQIRGSTFKLPFLSSVPLIMVAAGTGVAPFRAFIHERARLASVGKDVGRMMLFFGCQDESDYLYRDEFAEWIAGPLAKKLEVVTAFSRASNEKCYVQNKVEARGDEVRRMLLEDDAAFYICGAANMAKAVGMAVHGVVKQTNSWKDSEVESWRQDRKKSKRWFEDVWS